MNPTQTAAPDMNVIRQALLARANQPGMGQRPVTPALGQGAGGAPQIPNPGTPQPSSSPMGVPQQQPQGQPGFDETTKKMAKSLMSRLVSVL